jgi:sporulation protein YlmC with PRC-barrel domain
MPKKKQRAVDTSDAFESVVGVKVCCSDGIGGRVSQVIVNPVSQKVTDLVVKEDRWPQTKRMVPVKWVAKVKGGVIRLRCSRDELAKMEAFVEIGAYKKRNLPHQQADEWPSAEPSVCRVEPEIQVGHTAHGDDSTTSRRQDGARSRNPQSFS